MFFQLNGGTMCVSKAGLAAGTTTTISTTAATVFGIKGIAHSVAALTNQATPTTDARTGVAFVGVKANEGSVFVHAFNEADALVVFQGEVNTLDSGGNFTSAPEFPPIPDTVCPFGYLVIKAGATASTWTYGTSNQASATGITYSRKDTLPALPDRPVVA